ncbi:MAG: DUF4351 domain-containing protein [Thermoguttaceae bacterium]
MPARLHRNDALQGWSLFLACEPEELEEQMSVISKKNPVLNDVGKEFHRYASDNEMRELERSRMRYAAMQRIETGAAFELGEARGKAEGIAVGEARGKAEGIAVGEARGKAEGIAIGEARKIVRLLNRRFENVPQQLTESLLTIDDLNKLDALFDLAFDCKTLKEFQKAL